MAFDLDGYVDAATRLSLLLERYPLASVTCTEPAVRTIGERVFIAVTCTIDVNDGSGRTATASAWEPFPGRTPYTRDSEAMNAETSALGRCAGMLGFGVTKSIASANEVRNRRADEDHSAPGEAPRTPSDARKPRNLDLTPDRSRKATQRQIETLERMMRERGMATDDVDWDTLSADECSQMIDATKQVPRATR